MQTINDYRIESISAADLTASDLREEAQAMSDPQAFRVTFLDEKENALPEAADALYCPKDGRAGIAWGGNAMWTDAASIEDAITRFINDEMTD